MPRLRGGSSSSRRALPLRRSLGTAGLRCPRCSCGYRSEPSAPARSGWRFEAKGFATVIPRQTKPSCRSSDSRSRQPASPAAVTMIASKMPSRWSTARSSVRVFKTSYVVNFTTYTSSATSIPRLKAAITSRRRSARARTPSRRSRALPTWCARLTPPRAPWRRSLRPWPRSRRRRARRRS